MTWNLMCRVDNTDTIAMADLGWEDDALTVRFSKTKNDQAGNKGDLQRHIFANPLDCVMCPVTAMGLYLVSVSGAEPHLFHHTRQQKSLGEYMHAYFNSEEGKAFCDRVGVDPKQIGTHSIRKGSIASCICGTTASPNVLSALTRGGWAAGASWERYVHLLGAGQDTYIGRILAGMPVLEPEFALLPPHFDPHDEQVEEMVRSLFGRLLEAHPHLYETATQCLASVVHHAGTLVELLPSTHGLVHHELFKNKALLEKLRGQLYTDNRYASPYMQATGIPPHSLQLREMRIMQQKMQEQHEAAARAREESNERFIRQLEQLIERRTLEQGGITPALLQSMLRDTVEQIRHIGAPQGGHAEEEPSPRERASERPAAGQAGLQVYSWGNGFHLVPEVWRLPTNANLKTGWELWCRALPPADSG